MNAWKPIYTTKERIVEAVRTAGIVSLGAVFALLMVVLS